MIAKQFYVIPDEEKSKLVTEEEGFCFYAPSFPSFEDAKQQPECQLAPKVHTYIPYNSIQYINKEDWGITIRINYQLPGKSPYTYSFPLSAPSEYVRFWSFLEKELNMAKLRDQTPPRKAIQNGFMFIGATIFFACIFLLTGEKAVFPKAISGAGIVIAITIIMMIYRYKKPPFRTLFIPSSV